MGLRWQICSDLPPWHQEHQSSTGHDSLLRMGRDGTKGLILLKAQLLVQLVGLKWGQKICGCVGETGKCFCECVAFLVFWHIKKILYCIKESQNNLNVPSVLAFWVLKYETSPRHWQVPVKYVLWAISPPTGEPGTPYF